MFTRRNLLTTSGLVAAAIVLKPRQLGAIGPFEREAPGRLRLSLSAYSLRDELRAAKGQPPKLDLFGFVDYCRSLGLEGTELTSYYFPNALAKEGSNAAAAAPREGELDPLVAFVGELKRHCHLAGITVSGGAVGNDFTTNNVDTLKASQANVRRWVDLYQRLGAEAIRIFAGEQPKDEPWETTLPRLVSQIEQACAFANDNQVMLALENHGGVTATAERLLQIVNAVDSPAFGINLDSGNFRSGEDPYAELEMIAPYAINAQLKIETLVGGQRQEMDVDRVIKILRDAGYSGWLALEYEGTEPARESIPRWIDRMQKAMS